MADQASPRARRGTPPVAHQQGVAGSLARFWQVCNHLTFYYHVD